MPLTNYHIRKNPLDLNKNVRIGVAFPLNEQNLAQGTLTTKEQVKHNLISLLLTIPGERYHEPNFGVGIKSLIFENEINLEGLKNNIDEQIKFYIPGITLIDVGVDNDIDSHALYVSITYRFNADNSSDTIQLNFN